MATAGGCSCRHLAPAPTPLENLLTRTRFCPSPNKACERLKGHAAGSSKPLPALPNSNHAPFDATHRVPHRPRLRAFNAVVACTHSVLGSHAKLCSHDTACPGRTTAHDACNDPHPVTHCSQSSPPSPSKSCSSRHRGSGDDASISKPQSRIFMECRPTFTGPENSI